MRAKHIGMHRAALRLLGISTAAIALSGCSYGYALKAVAIDGKLAFIVDPASSHQPKCINAITVEVDDGETARASPVPGDDRKLVEVGTFWQQSMEPNCQNPFPIVYGQSLKGQRMIYGDGVPAPDRGEYSAVVKAKALKRGVVYSVATTSGATGYGGCYFRIAPDGRVESWREDPTPTSVDQNGYAIRKPYKPPPSQF